MADENYLFKGLDKVLEGFGIDVEDAGGSALD